MPPPCGPGAAGHACRRGEVLAQQHLVRLAQQLQDDGACRWEQEDADHHQRPQPRRGKHGPAEQKERRQCGRTRLRRRLSKSFHCDSADSGFFNRRLPGPGTRESSHPASCQSPRIQRCRRLMSAA